MYSFLVGISKYVGNISTSDCPERSDFLGFPFWYRGLQCDEDGGVVFEGLNDVWTILNNVVEMATIAAGTLAVFFLIWGGIQYITSQGDSGRIEQAKKIITNSIIGLVLAILAGTIVGFIAGRF